jgi:putative ABC transport system permease protein
MFQDFRFAFRRLRKAPGFTVAAVTVLALGMGASTAIFSVVDAVLLRPLPYPEQERIVELRELDETGHSMPFTEPNFLDLGARSHSFESLAEFGAWPLAVSGGTEPVRANAAVVSADFFRVLAVKPLLGRFVSSTREEGARQTVIVSFGFWKRFLNGRTDLSGMTLKMEGRIANVIGVLPAGVEYPPGTDVWFPREVYPPDVSRTAHNWRVIGRLRRGTSLEQARGEMRALGAQLKHELGQGTDASDFAVLPLRERLVKDVRGTLLAVSGAVGLLLVIACSNVANLLLVRASSRRKEIALRAALGASRGRLACQFVAEALLLTLAAGACGVLFSYWGVDLLLTLYNGALPGSSTVGVNPSVLTFSLIVSMLAGVVLGLVCAVNISRRHIQEDLKEGGRGSGGRVTSRVRNALIVSQIALSLMLLVAAGLLGKSFRRLLEVDPGFRPESVITMSVWTQTSQNAASSELARGYQQIIERFQHLPGVRAAGAISALPMSDGGGNGTFIVEDGSKRTGDAEYRIASADYFSVMGIPLLRGRFFQAADGPGSPHVALVSQSLARRYWPNDDAIGKQIQFGNMDGDPHVLNIVGIIGDVRDRSLDSEVRPAVYANYLQRPSHPEMSIVVRGEGDAAAVVNAMRREARLLNPGMPTEVHTLKEIVSTSLDSRRFSMVTLGAFAVAALVLAMVGLYGVMAFITAQRTREIGIRMALGAQRGDMLGLILRQSFALVVAGMALGILGAIGGAHLLGALLYGVGANDLSILCGVVALLGAAALMASYVPARRATKLDPMEALRTE